MRPFVEEPAKTLTTLGATMVLRNGGPTAINVLMQRKAT
jgi:hypothetical protein